MCFLVAGSFAKFDSVVFPGKKGKLEHFKKLLQLTYGHQDTLMGAAMLALETFLPLYHQEAFSTLRADHIVWVFNCLYSQDMYNSKRHERVTVRYEIQKVKALLKFGQYYGLPILYSNSLFIYRYSLIGLCHKQMTSILSGQLKMRSLD